MSKTFRYQHLRSTHASKKPSVSNLREGEIAVNIAAGNEYLYIKNANNEVIDFISEEQVDSKIETVNNRVNSNTNAISNEVTRANTAERSIVDSLTYSKGNKTIGLSVGGYSHTIDVSDFVNKSVASHTHPISDITNLQSTLDGKASTSHSHSVATASANGFMSSGDKSKLDGIASGANNYVHPTGNGYNHIPSGGSSGKFLGWSANGTAAWVDSADTWRPLGTGATDACAGNDSRLSNSRPASDVYSWAKASTKPTYIMSEVALMSVVTINANTSSTCSITGSGNAGKSQTIIYANGGTTSDYTVTVPTTYKTPQNKAIEIKCPKGGYCEINYLNIDGVIYARGA